MAVTSCGVQVIMKGPDRWHFVWYNGILTFDHRSNKAGQLGVAVTLQICI